MSLKTTIERQLILEQVDSRWWLRPTGTNVIRLLYNVHIILRAWNRHKWESFLPALNHIKDYQYK